MIRWGILGTARMATHRLLPAVHSRETIVAIGSRNMEKARAVAEQFGIPKAYGAYEDLLSDPHVDAVYIPLPNHLHVPWAIRAARAGKHVLIEKPIGLHAGEVEELIRASNAEGVRIGEAFMIVTHPRWIRAAELVRSGRLGALRTISGYFTIPLSERSNVRYDPEAGGGALLDLGCYQVLTARHMFGEEPIRVAAFADSGSGSVDRLFSMLLEFPGGHASFTCAFESAWAQRLNLIGTKARMDVELPTSAPEKWTSRIVIDDGSDPFGSNAQVEEFAPCNQYAVHFEAVAQAMAGQRPMPVSLEDSLANMRALDALARSARERHFISL